jgi:hypothetical protein
MKYNELKNLNLNISEQMAATKKDILSPTSADMTPYSCHTAQLKKNI